MLLTPGSGARGRAPFEQELASTDAGLRAPQPEAADPHDTSTGIATPFERAGFDPGAELEQVNRENRFYGTSVDAPRVGKYVLLEHLGDGGMGSVYTVYNPDLDRKSVIKLVRPDRSAPDSHLRLLREARLTATLSHPNVVVVHDCGEYRDQIYVVMEFIAGVDLDKWRRRGPHPWREVLAVYHAAGLGLAAAHTRPIVHRDFTPRNAMLGDDGRVRVLDFGLAHGRAKPASAPPAAPGPFDHLTASGAIVGTPRYMSPEQLCGAETDPRSDQFSFCVCLWEALLDVLPFAGETMYEYNASVLTGAVRMPDVTRGVPGRVLRALRRGLAPRPDDRWPDMPALLAALMPTPRPARWLLAPVAALGLAAGFMMMQAAPAQAAEQCAADLTGELHDIWDDTCRDAVQTTLAARDPRAAAAVVARLDAFAARWAERRQDLCTAALAGGLPGAAQRRGLQCLEGHRAVLGELATRLASGSAPDHGLTDLPDDDRLDACIDPLRIADGGAAASPAGREDAARIDADLARASAALILGQYAESEAIAAAAVSRARALGHPPTLAAALYHHARALAYGPRALHAEPALREAAGLAERHDMHDLAADVYLRLIRVAHRNGERPADADIWFEVLGHKLARLDEREGRRQAEALATLGYIALEAGDLASAERYAERSAAADEHANSFTRGLQELERGRIARARGELTAARGHFERATALASEALGERHPKLAPMLLGLGEVALALADLDAASTAFDRARALLGADDPFLGEALFDLARVAEARGDLAGAHTLGGQARVALRGPVPRDIARHRVKLLGLVVDVAGAMHDRETAISAARELLAIPAADRPGAEQRFAQACYNAAGVALSFQQPALALRLVAQAGRALADLPPTPQQEPLRVMLAIQETAALIGLGRPREAADVATRALQRWDPRDERDDAAIAELHLQLFDALQTFDHERASVHAVRALRYFADKTPDDPFVEILEAWLRRYPAPDHP
ncbi:MAG TPA: protein kinase [Nannocystis sp.]